jgi:hypothetical protein
MFLVLICTGCGGRLQPTVGFKPRYLPIQFTVGDNGTSITGDLSIETFVGTFSIGGNYLLHPPQTGSIYVTLRDQQTGFDKIYEIKTGSEELSVVVNGKTTIAVATSRVLINVTNGTVEKIRFKQVNGPAYSNGEGGPNIGQRIAARWDQGWSQSWYKPFSLGRWAYSNSTIEKWFGVGFVWFLIRLVVALLLYVVDLFLSLGFLIGQVAFIWLGPTARDTVYGVIVLLLLISGGSAIADSF